MGSDAMRRAARTIVVLPVLVLFLGGCACAPTLADERAVEPYATLLHRGDGLVHAGERVRTEGPGEPALRMQVVSLRAGPPRAGPLLVLVPGVLAGHETWRFLAPALADRFDLLLLDPPGTGGSDKPDPARTPPSAYTPTWLGLHALRAVEAWQRRHGDRREVVLVGHSLGSSALVRALGDDRTCRELPDLCHRIEGLVLFALPDVLATNVDPTLQAIAGLGDVEAEVGDAFGILGRSVAERVWKSVVDPHDRALRGEAERLTRMLGDAHTRHAAQAMLRRFRPVNCDDTPQWKRARALAAQEARVAFPVLLIWGRQDTTLPVSMAPVVVGRLQRAQLAIVDDARHSVQQERPRLAARLIGRFVRGLRAPPPAARTPVATPAREERPAALPPPQIVRHPRGAR